MHNTDEIEKLYQRVVTLHRDIDTIRQPLLNIKSVIDDIKKLLDLPATIARDLKKLHLLICALDEVMRLLDWVPGQFGSTCKIVHNLLSPLITPPKKAILDNLIQGAEEMDGAAKKIKAYLEKIEPPINQAIKEINTVHDKVVGLESTLAELVEHYKRLPPSPETIACVRAVNGYIDQFEQQVQKIKAQFDQVIAPLKDLLQSIESYLQPIADIANQVTNVLKMLDIKPISDLIRQVNQYKKKIEDFRKKVIAKFEWAVKKAFKQFGIDIDAINREISKLIDSALKPLRNFINQILNTLNNMLNRVTGMIEKLLPLDQLQKVLDTLRALRDSLQRELDKLAGTVCKAVLDV